MSHLYAGGKAVKISDEGFWAIGLCAFLCCLALVGVAVEMGKAQCRAEAIKAGQSAEYIAKVCS